MCRLCLNLDLAMQHIGFTLGSNSREVEEKAVKVITEAKISLVRGHHSDLNSIQDEEYGPKDRFRK